MVSFVSPCLTTQSRYYVDQPSIVVRGKPSAQMADKLEKDEKARIAAQVKKLGPDGLTKAEKLLEDAKAEHDKPIPNEIINAFPVPDVKTITWISVNSVQEPGKGRKVVTPSNGNPLSKHIGQDGDILPFFVQYDHVKVSTGCALHNLDEPDAFPFAVRFRDSCSVFLTS